MGEQKNLFLAIGLSVAIIVIFQILFPQQTAMTPPAKNEVENNYSQQHQLMIFKQLQKKLLKQKKKLLQLMIES